MYRMLLVVLALVGLISGAAAGYLLRAEPGAAQQVEPRASVEARNAQEYVDLDNQFIVPVVEQGDISAMVVLGLGLEVTAGSKDAIYQLVPRLRDALLRVMFDHANAGGFSGNFTEGGRLDDLRRALLEAAQKVAGDAVTAVLISNIARQGASPSAG